jgi:hypothetical protein
VLYFYCWLHLLCALFLLLAASVVCFISIVGCICCVLYFYCWLHLLCALFLLLVASVVCFISIVGFICCVLYFYWICATNIVAKLEIIQWNASFRNTHVKLKNWASFFSFFSRSPWIKSTLLE